jgi:hypothetical protein
MYVSKASHPVFLLSYRRSLFTIIYPGIHTTARGKRPLIAGGFDPSDTPLPSDQIDRPPLAARSHGSISSNRQANHGLARPRPRFQPQLPASHYFKLAFVRGRQLLRRRQTNNRSNEAGQPGRRFGLTGLCPRSID